ncbi:MAG: hypothetical protein NTV65_09535 [Proteobacteria bacterium]|nr:hypothetical protein [Pseudomonadota bacterium]
MITTTNLSSDQIYTNTESLNPAEIETVAPQSGVDNELSSTLKMIEASPQSVISQDLKRPLIILQKLIDSLRDLLRTPGFTLPSPKPPGDINIMPYPLPTPKPPGDIRLPITVPMPIPPRKPIEQGSALDRSAGFLWKPESDKNQKLAILLPPNLAGKVAEVIVLSPDGKLTLQRGKYSGVGNGAREHYRFSKAGSEFPDGSIVVIKLKDGTTKHMVINETSARLEKK